jgi:hypothetical protein
MAYHACINSCIYFNIYLNIFLGDFNLSLSIIYMSLVAKKHTHIRMHFMRKGACASNNVCVRTRSMIPKP